MEIKDKKGLEEILDEIEEIHGSPAQIISFSSSIRVDSNGFEYSHEGGESRFDLPVVVSGLKDFDKTMSKIEWHLVDMILYKVAMENDNLDALKNISGRDVYAAAGIMEIRLENGMDVDDFDEFDGSLYYVFDEDTIARRITRFAKIGKKQKKQKVENKLL